LIVNFYNRRTDMKLLKQLLTLATTGALMALMPVGAQAQAPIRIGSTLALTGPLSATAMTHKLVGEIYVEQLNARGGLLGRKDRQRRPVQARPCPHHVRATGNLRQG
jgi:hypothetical protein